MPGDSETDVSEEKMSGDEVAKQKKRRSPPKKRRVEQRKAERAAEAEMPETAESEKADEEHDEAPAAVDPGVKTSVETEGLAWLKSSTL